MFSENFIFIDTALESINFFALDNKKNYSLKIKNISKSENLPILLKKFLSSNKIKINKNTNIEYVRSSAFNYDKDVYSKNTQLEFNL